MDVLPRKEVPVEVALLGSRTSKVYLGEDFH